MMRDERGLPVSTDSAEAALLFDRAVEHYLKFHADTMALVGQMLAADPGFALGHCFKGYLLLSASNPAFATEIAATLAKAEAAAASATERERQHVAAFAAWAGGSLDRSFAIWRQLLDTHALVGLRDVLDRYPFEPGWAEQKLQEWANSGRAVVVQRTAAEGESAGPMQWSGAAEGSGDGSVARTI